MCRERFIENRSNGQNEVERCRHPDPVFGCRTAQGKRGQKPSRGSHGGGIEKVNFVVIQGGIEKVHLVVIKPACDVLKHALALPLSGLSSRPALHLAGLSSL